MRIIDCLPPYYQNTSLSTGENSILTVVQLKNNTMPYQFLTAILCNDVCLFLDSMRFMVLYPTRQSCPYVMSYVEKVNGIFGIQFVWEVSAHYANVVSL